MNEEHVFSQTNVFAILDSEALIVVPLFVIKSSAILAPNVLDLTFVDAHLDLLDPIARIFVISETLTNTILEKCPLLNDCSGNGLCKDNFTCVCTAPFGGTDCSLNLVAQPPNTTPVIAGSVGGVAAILIM
jgi:hypothetical protein